MWGQGHLEEWALSKAVRWRVSRFWEEGLGASCVRTGDERAGVGWRSSPHHPWPNTLEVVRLGLMGTCGSLESQEPLELWGPWCF